MADEDGDTRFMKRQVRAVQKIVTDRDDRAAREFGISKERVKLMQDRATKGRQTNGVE